MGFLTGKRALIVGVASDRSIASGIALAMHREGAEIAFSYQTDKLKSRVESIAAECNSKLVFPCDVAFDESIADFYRSVNAVWDSIDILVHSVAFAPGDNLSGDFVESTTREGFKIAHDISSYSLVALAKTFLPMMENRNSAILTLTYLGAERVLPNYNVMGLAKASLEANVKYMAASLGPKGVRVNTISAGPIRTLAASGIKDLRKMLHFYESANPLRQNITIEQVGNAAAFLCSDLASGITGECVHVDAGFHCIAMGPLE